MITARTIVPQYFSMYTMLLKLSVNPSQLKFQSGPDVVFGRGGSLDEHQLAGGNPSLFGSTVRQ